jgi:hypothetical protein
MELGNTQGDKLPTFVMLSEYDMILQNCRDFFNNHNNYKLCLLAANKR